MKSKLTYTLQDIHKVYKKDMKGSSSVLQNSKVYIKAMKEVLWELARMIIVDRYTFVIKRAGKIRIRQRMTKFPRMTDYSRLRETGKIYRHTNTHTGSKYFYWFWDKEKPDCYFTNQVYYKFKPVRDEKNRQVGTRGLAAWIFKCASDPKLKDYTALS